MRTLKKLTCLLLAMMMVFALAAAAYADGTPVTYSIRIEEAVSGHTYQAYQILQGDLMLDNQRKVLSNVAWGTGISDTGKTALMKKYSVADAAGLAEKLGGKNENGSFSVSAEDFAKTIAADAGNLATGTMSGAFDQTSNAYVISGLAAGYYLVNDMDANNLNAGDAYSHYIVQIVGDVTVAPKVSNVTFQKKLKDKNDTAGTETGWQDSADYDIGDAIPFQLKATVAKDYMDYTSAYYFAFHDKMENGLTFNKDSVKVYAGAAEDNRTDITNNANVTVVTQTNDECTFEVQIANLKEVSAEPAGKYIFVEYTATLNEKAALGEQGNKNDAKLEYSNHPYSDQKGETSWDSVIAFTYKVVVNKYANEVKEDNELAGAEFTLEKKVKDSENAEIDVVKNTDGTSFEFKGLDDGEYILIETKTPAGYNTIEPIEFTVTAEHTITWEGEDRNTILTSLSGVKKTGEITLTASGDKSTLTTDVVNKSGSTLPETGGMGTTLFYVLGGVLVLAAVVLLVTKKRMHSEN